MPRKITVSLTLEEAEALHTLADIPMGDDEDIEAALGGDSKSPIGKAAYRAIDKLNKAIQAARNVTP